jgi:DNA-binding transcriptional LysR family regulator
MKHAESTLGMRLFSRRNGRYAPTPEAKDIFNQINGVYDKVEDLQFVIGRLKRGGDSIFRVGSVPSISNMMAPRAIASLRRRFPDLVIDIDVLKIEEAIDYLLLGKGEVVAMSYRYEHPMLTFQPVANGRLVCIVPASHPLSAHASISAAEIARHPLIGIDPSDPYGRIMANIFTQQKLTYDVVIKARFGSTVCALVSNGLGIAVIDQFTAAAAEWPGVRQIPITEPTEFQTYVAFRKDATLSAYSEHFIAALRAHMEALEAPLPGRGVRTPAPASRRAKK